MTTAGRLFRYLDRGWVALDQPLGEYPHAPVRNDVLIAPWVVPRSCAPKQGDIVVVHEQAHRLLMRIPPDDPAWDAVARQASALASAEDVSEWLGSIELWLGQRLAEPNNWPVPPE